MSGRTLARALVAFALPALVLACAEEFTGVPEEHEARIDTDIWPESLVVGVPETFSVLVTDAAGNQIVEPQTTWQLQTPGMVIVDTSDVSVTVVGTRLGPQSLSVSLNQRPFSRADLHDSTEVVLGGVSFSEAVEDTLFIGAISDTLIVPATGLDGLGGPVGLSGLQWDNQGKGIVFVLAFPDADSARIVAADQGEEWVRVSNPACLGTCADSVLVTVAPTVATLTVLDPGVSLIAGDTVSLTTDARDRNGSTVPGAQVSWSVTDGSIASIDSTGLLTALDSGTVTVVAFAPPGVADSLDLQIRPTGTIEAQLTDAPSDYLVEARVRITDVFVVDPSAPLGRRSLLAAPGWYDLLTLQGDSALVLGSSLTPTGSVTEVVVRIDSASVRLAPGYSFPGGGGTQTLPVPAGADSIPVVLPSEITLVHADTARVLIEFDVNRNFPLDAEPVGGVVQGVSFAPDARGADLDRVGEIAGSIAVVAGIDPTSILLRAALSGTSDTLTTRTASDGSYGFYFLEPGTYDLTALDIPQCHVLNPTTRSVGVAAATTSANEDFSLDSIRVDSMVVSLGQSSAYSLSDTILLAATALDSLDAQTPVTILYQSSDPSVATVAPDGTVVTVGDGTTSLTASSCGVSASASLTVTQTAASVQITNPASGGLGLQSGDGVQLAAAVQDSNGIALPGGSVVWATSDPAIVTVTGSGFAQAVGPGGGFVTATSGAFADTVAVSVLVPGLRVRPVASGNGFTCDVDAGGNARCWGRNQSGQLGDGTTVDRAAPVSVVGGIPLRSLTAGWEHACGLTPAGDAYCWGRNWEGQLGNGTTNAGQTTPTAVTGGVSFLDISAGDYSTCGLSSTGEVLCWGTGGDGQIGNGSTSTATAPTPVSGGRSYVSLDAGGRGACAIGDDQVTYCWGRNVAGSGVVSVPTAVSGGLVFQSLSVGQVHACAIDGQQDAYCWGASGNWLGLGGAPGSIPPVQPVGGFPNWIDIDAGSHNTCAVDTGLQAHCWGNNNNGEFGNTTRLGSGNPTLMSGGLNFDALSLGVSHVCAVTTGQETYCWGDRAAGSLGDGEAAWAVLPQSISGQAATQVSTGASHGCLTTTTGQGRCWGRNAQGQLGNGSTLQQNAPVDVGLATSLSQISVSSSGQHTCAITASRDAYCWGLGSSGQLGDSTFSGVRVTPTEVLPASRDWLQIELGANSTCGIATDSLAYCWGRNIEGQLGDGSGVSHPMPVAVSGGHKFVDLAMADNAACALRQDSALFCWGRTFSPAYGSGGVGDGTDLMRTTPVEVGAGIGFKAITGGGAGTFCAIALDDAAWCWGDGYRGKLGDGQWGYQPLPTPVAGGHTFQWLSTGPTHTCGRSSANQILCWGEGDFGQLGTGLRSDHNTPQLGAGGLTFNSGSAGQWVTCGIDASGQLYCWGSRREGRTGEGFDAWVLQPRRVS